MKKIRRSKRPPSEHLAELRRMVEYYRKQGLCVIPIKYGSKKPAIPSWEQYQHRQPTDEEIKTWFYNAEEQAPFNIGIICGKVSGNLFVLDFDDFKNFKKVYGTRAKGTINVETSRGRHIYFQSDYPVGGFKVKELSIDIKGEGGYVLAPPSIHPNGKEYKLSSHPIEGEPQIDTYPGDVRQELLMLLQARIKGFKAKDHQKAVDIESLLNGVASGARNEAAIRVASWFRQKRGFDKTEGWEQLKLWNQHNTPPMNEGELRVTFESAYERDEPYDYRFKDEVAEREFFDTKTVEEAEVLLDNPKILEFIQTKALADVIGNIKFKTSLFLINLIYDHGQVLGDTATGKSHTADRVMDCFPRHTWFKVTGVTDKAIRYLGQNIQHLYLCEWGAVGGKKEEESTAQYDVKILASEGKLKLLLVAKDEHGNLRTQWVETEVKNIITTSTNVSLPQEQLNRFWQFAPEKLTKKVVHHKLDQTTKFLSERTNCEPSRQIVRCAVELLEKERPDAYVIPYGKELQKIFDELSERARSTRDVDKLIRLIHAMGLLHIRHRVVIEEDGKRHLICTVEDFFNAWSFGDDAITGTFAELTKRGNETFEMCKKIRKDERYLTSTTLSTMLETTTAAAGDWLRKFERIGYLRREGKLGRANFYEIGSTVPDEEIVIKMSDLYAATEKWLSNHKFGARKQEEILGSKSFLKKQILVRIPAFLLASRRLQTLQKVGEVSIAQEKREGDYDMETTF